MDDFPYYQIPDPPAELSPGGILSRLADGIGFRLRWAADGLTEADLAFKPAPDCMSLGELLEHIHALLRWVGQSVRLDEVGKPMRRAKGLAARDAAVLLAEALSRHFARSSVADLSAVRIRGMHDRSFPVWNLVNGPLADSLTHIGQIASWRRIMGKPVAGADVFQGRPPGGAV